MELGELALARAELDQAVLLDTEGEYARLARGLLTRG